MQGAPASEPCHERCVPARRVSGVVLQRAQRGRALNQRRREVGANGAAELPPLLPTRYGAVLVCSLARAVRYCAEWKFNREECKC